MKVTVMVPKPFDTDVQCAINEYKDAVDRSHTLLAVARRNKNSVRLMELLELLHNYDLSTCEIDKSQLVEIEVEL